MILAGYGNFEGRTASITVSKSLAQVSATKSVGKETKHIS